MARSEYFLTETVNKAKMQYSEKKRLVDIGRTLCTLTDEDIAYIMNPQTTEGQCQARMISARHRL